ncbi:TM2 domain-containing protein [Rhodohalobacter sp.]|uniref:TM2 domain-containing protein n=1 Tax=Rhodohalobacter sp. TaxID=1974210 RepID=UPI002ACF0626|nr:TM2 domain-containing protein [Rhodohalobacter sp.]MDZ7757655.1 TM2 domain-containing protein [Rhodohalobacter sp.]
MKVFEHMPELEGDEMQYINRLLNDMPEDKIETFVRVYEARRKDPILLLILALIGFFGVAGIHRFFVGHIGMGILYILTAGLCFIGTIVDMINYKNFAFEYNRKIALEVKGELNL